jgi:AcrR family transcriptional regulator
MPAAVHRNHSGPGPWHQRVLSGPDRRPPGRPRSERASRAIIGATLEMLVEGVSVDSLSMEAVAARAGVGKATLYRRWPNKQAVVSDALASLYEPPAAVSNGSVRQNLVAAVADLRRWAVSSTAGRLLPHFLGGMCRSPELQAQYVQSVIEPRKAVLREILRRGVASRDLDPRLDPEVTLTVVFGSVLFDLVLAAADADGQCSPERFVDLILPGITSGEPPRR